MAASDYDDGATTPRLIGLPNPRSVGVSVMRQREPSADERGLSGYVYAFGNLLSHDLQRTASGSTESISFRIPAGDDQFLPNQTLPLTRSLFDETTGSDPANPRQQTNFTTAFIDASPIYGANDVDALILRGGPARSFAKLKTSDDINGDGENMLPHDAFGPRPDAGYVAGDNRVNDNIALTSLHTVFMREHNRLVEVYAAAHPEWTSEELYQRARKFVGAEMQAITFNEYLPALLGPYAPASAGVYDPHLEPVVFNEIAAVFLRIGHSMLTSTFKLVENDGSAAADGEIPLEDGINNPSLVSTSQQLELLLKGLSFEVQERNDLQLADGMRLGLLDAIDIQRARDHGIPGYNALREALALPPAQTFADLTTDVAVQDALRSLYLNVDDLDPLVGALAEEHLPGASVGPLVAAAMRRQFELLRDGDRFWYENDGDFSAHDLAKLRSTRLSDIIARNTGVRRLPANVFFAVPEPPALAAALTACAVGWAMRRSVIVPGMSRRCSPVRLTCMAARRCATMAVSSSDAECSAPFRAVASASCELPARYVWVRAICRLAGDQRRGWPGVQPGYLWRRRYCAVAVAHRSTAA